MNSKSSWPCTSLTIIMSRISIIRVSAISKIPNISNDNSTTWNRNIRIKMYYWTQSLFKIHIKFYLLTKVCHANTQFSNGSFNNRKSWTTWIKPHIIIIVICSKVHCINTCAARKIWGKWCSKDTLIWWGSCRYLKGQ